MLLLKTYKDKSKDSPTGATRYLFLKVLPSQIEKKHVNELMNVTEMSQILADYSKQQ